MRVCACVGWVGASAGTCACVCLSVQAPIRVYAYARMRSCMRQAVMAGLSPDRTSSAKNPGKMARVTQ